MRARHAVPVAALMLGLAAAALPGTRATQEPVLAAAGQGLGDPRLEQHLDQVALARWTLLEEAWASALPERRAALVAWFQGRRSLGIGALHLPSARLATEAWRVLCGGDPGDPLQALADSLDLRVQPGAVEATDDRVGEPVIVRVLPLWSSASGTDLPEEVELELVWLGPAGQELRAGSTGLRPAELRLPGFELYPDGPADRGGAWTLVPEVVAGEARRRGPAVAVPCVRDLHRRFERALERLPDGQPRAALEAWVRHGVRDARVPDLEELLEAREPGALAARWPAALHLASGDLAGYELLPPPGVEERACVVLHAPRGLKPDLALGGRPGEAWRAAAAGGVRVVSSAVPLLGGDLRGLAALLAELRAEGDRPLVLLVEGSELGLLPTAFGADAATRLDGLVAVSVHAPGQGPRRLLAGVPQLSLEPLADVPEPRRESAQGHGEPDLVWLRDPRPPRLARAAQVREIADWAAGLGTRTAR